jgi:hypothetical protein
MSTIWTASFASQQHLLIGGDVGYHQVPTGSITIPGDAFVGLIDVATGDLIDFKRWGTKNRRDTVLGFAHAVSLLHV